MDNKTYLINDDCLKILPQLEANSIDTCITDPPYHLTSIVKRFGKKGSAPAKIGKTGAYSRHSTGFMGKTWDGGDIAFRSETWEEVYRVLKPGATLLAFGGTRTYHRLAVAIEDAGFEIKDCIFWIYGTGFPKSYNIGKGIDKKFGMERKIVGIKKHPTSKDRTGNKSPYQAENSHLDGNSNITIPSTLQAQQWDGWGTALKPACEPIVVAMKPRDGTFVNNALKWGVAGLNIDAGRIAGEEVTINTWDNGAQPFGEGAGKPFTGRKENKGRWPANVILDEEAAKMLDEQTGELKSGAMDSIAKGGNFNVLGKQYKRRVQNNASKGGASRFFYMAKTSRKERHAGLEGTEKNNHPTVKPLELMRYLCKLTATPTGGTILDPFMGSGTTGKAAKLEGRGFIGIELEKEYFTIAKTKIDNTIQSDIDDET